MAANQLLVENSNKLRMAIGRAVMHWSAVEMETQFIFRALFGDDTDTADIVWGTLVSMDARLSVCCKSF